MAKPQFNRPTPDIPWYKTTGGIIFVIIVSLFLFVVIGFMTIVGYYSLKIKLGNEEDIISQLKKTQAQFSTLVTENKQVTITPADILTSIDKQTPAYGNESANTTILVFIDFECPFCRQAYATFRDVTKDRNDIRVYFKHFPLTSIHPNAGQAALAGECAREQQSFWSYYDLLFIEKRLNNNSLIEYAETLELNMPQFTSCLRTQKYLSRVQKDFEDGVRLGVRGTPTYIVNTQKFEGVISTNKWNSVLK